ncbi:hypothetical protein HK100_003034 [Physocladia obscura]|uniref:Uncharacterized protein n=1 Tax=Physocladia obscura TaxID=109957 RepID=A0AAD5SWP3_9FUNG|nr:hypothetical protein HK100_003034 [Physocladia obscura]
MKTRDQILDECSIVDRQKFLEIISVLWERNKNHVILRDTIVNQHFENIFSENAYNNSPSDLGNISFERLNEFRNSVFAIPSFAANSQVVDETLRILESETETGQDKLLNMLRAVRSARESCKSIPDAEKVGKQKKGKKSAFRERKQQHIRNLEDEVASLKQQLAVSSSPTSSATPPTQIQTTNLNTNLHPILIQQNIQTNDDISKFAALSARVASLEAENAAMRMHNVSVDFASSFPAGATPNECVTCAVEKMKTLLALGHAKVLEGKVVELQVECQTLRLLLGSMKIVSNNTSTYNSPMPARNFDRDNDAIMHNIACRGSTLDLLSEVAFQRHPSNQPTPVAFGENFVENPEALQKMVDNDEIIRATELFGHPDVDFARQELK